MRKLFGMIVLIAFLLAYVIGATLIGSRIVHQHALLQAVFYIIAGTAWAFPLKPLMRWMHARDKPLPSTEI